MSEVHGRVESGWAALRNTVKLLSRKHSHYKGAGFEVRLKSTWEIEYIEGDQHLSVPSEIGVGSTRWWDTWVMIELYGVLCWRGEEEIHPTHRPRIAANIAEAFTDFDIPFEILQ